MQHGVDNAGWLAIAARARLIREHRGEGGPPTVCASLRHRPHTAYAYSESWRRRARGHTHRSLLFPRSIWRHTSNVCRDLTAPQATTWRTKWRNRVRTARVDLYCSGVAHLRAMRLCLWPASRVARGLAHGTIVLKHVSSPASRRPMHRHRRFLVDAMSTRGRSDDGRWKRRDPAGYAHPCRAVNA